MAYDESLAQRVREELALATKLEVEEKHMFGGLAFMVDGKMCVGVLGGELMVRLDPEIYESSLSRPGAKPMEFTGRPMKGFVFVEATATQRDLNEWLDLALAFNKKAKPSKRRKRS